MEPVSFSATFGMTSNTYPQTHENTSKAHIQPNLSTTKDLNGALYYKKS